MSVRRIGIIRERKSPPDFRVPLSPRQCADLMERYPVKVVVEPSPIRVFRDEEYEELGIELSDDLSQCDVLLGIKEVPPEKLIEGKQYFFFSHTIKEQPYNRNLLRAVLEKKVTLTDWECLEQNAMRLIGFGRYAGIVGAYNGLKAYGLRYELFELPPVHELTSMVEMKKIISKVNLPPIKIVLTGRGKVAHGAMETLAMAHVDQVSIKEFLNNAFDEPVYVQLDIADYNKKADGGKFERYEFYRRPDLYISNFQKYTEVADMFIAGHFWGEGAPAFFTEEEAKSPHFNIKVVADISCDIDGPIASTIRSSSIDNPIYGYDRQSGAEVKFNAPGSITVMAVDNLPAELPRDASEGFGEQFMDAILPELMKPNSEILENATIARNGRLTENFSYLQSYVEGR